MTGCVPLACKAAMAGESMNEGLVTTVCEPVSGETLGFVLPHEHLLIDLRNQFTPPSDPTEERRSREPVRAEDRALLLCNPYALSDNLLLDDLKLALSELQPVVDAGVRTIVDCTCVGIGRKPSELRALARQTGLHVIAGCGYYTADTHGPDIAGSSETALAEAMLRDLREGMDGTDIRAGVIGELGTSKIIDSGERKVLRAAALAWSEYPVGITIHAYPWRGCGVEAALILLRSGVAPERIVICHPDVEPDETQIRELLRLGVFVEFDNFGKEFTPPVGSGFGGGRFITDAERISLFLRLLDAGAEKQLLLSNDVCLKCLLSAHGGGGYVHVMEHILPRLAEAGVRADTIRTITQDNPRRWLCGL